MKIMMLVSIVEPNLLNSVILDHLEHKLIHLAANEAASISSLLQVYRDLFDDLPCLCTLLEHDIETTDANIVSEEKEKVPLIRNSSKSKSLGISSFLVPDGPFRL